MLVALPRAGKTTYRNTHKDLKKYYVVCPDELRLSVYRKRFDKNHEAVIWDMVYEMVDIAFEHSDNVILDATNTTKKARKKFIDPDRYETVVHQLTTDKDICITRAIASDQKDLVDIIKHMSTTFQNPSIEEGIKDIIIVG